MIKKLLEYLQKLFFVNERPIKEYSLDEYIDIIGEFTDEVIRNEEDNSRYYTGGDCLVECIVDNKVRFYIRMYFIDDNKKRFMKESERVLRLTNFDSESQEYLRQKSRIFEIFKPRMER